MTNEINDEVRLAMLKQILEANKDKPFVQRIMNPEAHPTAPNPDGSVSTHLMASGEADGKHFAYPTMTVNRGKGKNPGIGLKGREDRDAFRHAFDTGNMIEFPSADEADWFAQNYKQAWE